MTRQGARAGVVGLAWRGALGGVLAGGLAGGLLAGCGATVVLAPAQGADAGDLADAVAVADGVAVTDSTDAQPDTGNGCLGGEPRCNGRCTDTTIDPAHCGACSTPCAMGDLCESGVCRPVCRAPRMDCSDGCVDPTTSVTDCGACGRACPAGDACMGGHCHGPNDPTYTLVMDTAAASGWIDACAAPGSRGVLPMVDDGDAQVPLPFAFRFWGTTVPAGQSVNVCSNGWIGLDGMPSNALTGMLPGTVRPWGVIAAHWADLVTSPQGVCVATVGMAPSRRFVVEWPDARYYSGGGSLTFETVLNETTGEITVQDLSMTASRMATVGTDNLLGDSGVSLCSTGGAPCPWHSGDRVVLTPVH